jgi:hypothetical protein
MNSRQSRGQTFASWHTDYPSTHVRAGESVQVVTMEAFTRYRDACERCSDALFALVEAVEKLDVRGEIGDVEEYDEALASAQDLLAGEPR